MSCDCSVFSKLLVKKIVLMSLLLSAGRVCHAKADDGNKGMVGVFMLGRDSAADWLAEDEAVFKKLSRALESKQIKIMQMQDFGDFFQEPPDPKVEDLYSSALTHLEKGRQLSTRLKPKLAIKEFSEALRELRAIFPYLKDLSALERAHLDRGMTYQALGRDALARQEYRMVLLLHPNRKLDDALVSPLVVETFEEVRKNLFTSLKGSISVISKPAGAILNMDGKQVGRTPITVPGVIPGEHYLSLLHPGYKIWFGVLKVPEGAMEKQEVFLAEGARIDHWRLLRKVASLGASKADMDSLLKGLGVELLLLFEFDHVGAKTVVKVVSGMAGGSPVALGVFPIDGEGFDTLVNKLRHWVAGDRKELIASGVDVVKGKIDKFEKTGVTLEPEKKWYEKWWVWTIAAAVLVGAGAAATAALAGGDSGIQVEVYR